MKPQNTIFMLSCNLFMKLKEADTKRSADFDKRMKESAAEFKK